MVDKLSRRAVGAVLLMGLVGACVSRPTRAKRPIRTAITVTAPDSQDRFRRLITALVAKHPGETVEFLILSSDEALAQLAQGGVDIIIPYAPANSGSQSPVRLSRSPVMKGYQILYTNRAQPLDPAALDGRRIETSASMTASLPFPTLPSAGPDASFARLTRGEIDGYINAEGVADAALKRLGLTNIHRHLYRVIDGHIAIGDGPRAAEIDALITAAVVRAQANGDPVFQMMQERTYGDWQPY